MPPANTLDDFILGQGKWEGSTQARYQQDDYAIHRELTRAVGEHLELSGGLRLPTSLDHTTSSFSPTPYAVSLSGKPLGMDRRNHFDAALPMDIGGEYHESWGGIARLDWHYATYLFARNLLGTEYYTHTYLFQGAPAASPGIPRIMGVEMRATF